MKRLLYAFNALTLVLATRTACSIPSRLPVVANLFWSNLKEISWLNKKVSLVVVLVQI